MKSHSRSVGLVFAVLGALGFAGCQQAGNPVAISRPQVESPGTTGATPGSAPASTPTPAVQTPSHSKCASCGATPAPVPTVGMTQTCSSATALLGGSVTYTLNLAVSGASAGNVTVQDVLPSGMSYVQGSATSLSGGTFACTGQKLTWVYSSVGPCNCAMSYVAQVNGLLGLVGSVLSNTAVLTCSSLSAAVSATTGVVVSALATGTPTPSFTPAPSTSTPTPAPPTPTFTSTPVPPTFTPSFTPTDTFTFTNTPTRTFTPTATATSTSTNTFTPVPPTPTRTFTPVPPTPTFTFTATRTFTPAPPTPTRTFTPVPPPPTATSTPIPVPTVSFSQTCSSLSAALGGAVTYTVHLAVSGCAATHVTVQDVLPAGMSYVQGSATAIAGGAFSSSGQTLTWVYNSVGPCDCSMSYVAQVNNVLGLVGSTLTNNAVLTCPSLSSSLSASSSLQVLASLLGSLGL